MTFVRGVLIVAIQMARAGIDFIFTNLWSTDQESVVKPHMEKVVLPPEMKVWRTDAMTALVGLRALCKDDPVRTKYLEMTVEMARSLQDEPLVGKCRPLILFFSSFSSSMAPSVWL